MASYENDKPYYGPPMTPDIFATKWLIKFRDFLYHRFGQPSNPSPNKAWLCIFCEEGFEYLLHFKAQAAELSLNQNSFPDEPRPARLKEPHEFDVRSADDCPAAKVNPFRSALAAIGLVDQLTLRLEAMKTKGERMDGARWQDIPLEWRMRMNELFPKIDKAHQDGWWVFPGEERSIKDWFRKNEELGAFRR